MGRDLPDAAASRKCDRELALSANFGQWIPLIDGYFAVIRSYNWTILAAAMVQRTSNGAYGGWFFL
jgi:hypothetical protein